MPLRFFLEEHVPEPELDELEVPAFAGAAIPAGFATGAAANVAPAGAAAFGVLAPGNAWGKDMDGSEKGGIDGIEILGKPVEVVGAWVLVAAVVGVVAGVVVTDVPATVFVCAGLTSDPVAVGESPV